MKNIRTIYLLAIAVIFSSCDPIDTRLRILNKSGKPMFVAVYVPRDSALLVPKGLIPPDSSSFIPAIFDVRKHFVDSKFIDQNCTRIYYFTDEFTISNSRDLFLNMHLLYKTDTITFAEAEFVDYKFVVH
jgi:hypothetical protein